MKWVMGYCFGFIFNYKYCQLKYYFQTVKSLGITRLVDVGLGPGIA